MRNSRRAAKKQSPDFFDSDPLAGLNVTLADTCKCGSAAAVVGKGAGPHAAALRCVPCGAFRGWLPRAAHGFITITINKFGRPTKSIAIRRGQGAPAAGTLAPTQPEPKER
jgi:hypothetical protein